MAELLIVLIILAIPIGIMWIFYQWGASIAQGKGRSRSLGWWAAFFGLIGIVGLYMMSDETPRTYIPSSAPIPPVNVAEQLQRLANLKDKGVLSQEEFDRQKQAILG
jgi:hypothetical protein